MKRKLAAAVGREISVRAHPADPSCNYERYGHKKEEKSVNMWDY